MAELLDTAWTFPLKRTTQNKRAKRTGVPQGSAHELIGFDGSLEGGLSPHQGFKQVVDLTYGFGTSPDQVGAIRGFFPFSCNVGNDSFAYGYVYRVEGEGGNAGLVQYRILYRIGDSGLWRTDFSTSGLRDGVAVGSFDTGLIGTEQFNDEQMDFVTVGRFNYVFRKGLDPFMFYFLCEDRAFASSSSAGSEVSASSCSARDFELIVLTDLGPGNPPEWQQTEPHTCQVSTQVDGGPATTHPDMVEVITEMTVPTVVGSARVMFFGFSALALIDSTSLPGFQGVTNPRLVVRNTTPVDISEPLTLLTELVDENDVQLWAAPPYTEPTFEIIGGVPGIMNPATFIEGGIRAYRVADMANMLWAYRLWDSRTGRFSALSPTVEIESDLYGSVPAVQIGDDEDLIQAVTTVPLFQLIYDAAVYDTVLLFRGTPAGDLNPNQTVLSLELQLKLEPFWIDTLPAGAGPYKVAAVFPTLTNDALALQPKFNESLTFLADMPKAGAAFHFEGSMIVGNIGGNSVEDAGLSQVRWSSLYQISVELFDPSAKYPLLTATDETERIIRAGPNVWGLSRLAHYLFRKETTFMKVFPMHQGYGIVNSRAACEVGSMLYLTTRHGIKTIKPAGELSDITVANSLIKEEWKNDLNNVEMAYDSEMGLIVVMNPDLEKIWMAWLETSMTTELHDTVFKHVTEGLVPQDPSLGVTASNPLEPRAVFVSEIEIEPVQGSGVFKNWRVMVVDMRREKTGTRLLDHTGTARSSALAAIVNQTTFTLPFSATAAMQLENAYVYLMDGTSEGSKHRIRYVRQNGDVVFATGITTDLDDRLGISPVFCRWTGFQLGLQAGEEQQFSFGNDDDFRVRQPTGLACHFVDVDGSAASDGTNKDARFKAQIYKGNKTTVEGADFPKSIDGKTDAEQKYLSVLDGPSAIYASFGDLQGVLGAATFPSIEIVCPDLEFRLLSVRVTGKITADQREGRPSVE